MNKLQTFLLRQYYLIKESKFYITKRNLIRNIFKLYVPKLLTIIFASVGLWLVLNLFHIIELTRFTYLQTIAFYFILSEIDIRYLMFITKQGKKWVEQL